MYYYTQVQILAKLHVNGTDIRHFTLTKITTSALRDRNLGPLEACKIIRGQCVRTEKDKTANFEKPMCDKLSETH